MEIRLSIEGIEGLLENIAEFLSLDASDDEQYEEGLDRLIALQMQLEDILRLAAGDAAEPLTEAAEIARTNDPYYRRVSILPKDGRNP